ncbi:MAG TPA: 2Fe-2S iron-sulfur cluster binding domain-containing protein [Streptosporangiaceae bacterium]|nr:2Fe-2S iron-sulfur cluster binding domain-containing protein [Streptosporangiaceae bacterium]
MLLTFEGRDYELRPGESVLEGMARHGVGLPSACRAGSCQACLVRAVRGDPGPDAHRGLKETWRECGYFLACVARPASDLTVAQPGSDVFTPATLSALHWLVPGVLRVRLRPERPIGFRGGQHLTLSRGDGVTRSYSVANLPAEAERVGLEFHVRVYPGGAMSEWLARARPGARLRIGAPAGECFYTPGNPGRTLLLAGTGTGIGPLMAIAKDALARHHAGPIVLIHGAARPAGLYLGTRCPDLETGCPPGSQQAITTAKVSWQTCVLSDGADIEEVVNREYAALGDRTRTAKAYLCGGSGSVTRMRRALFMAGMSLADIHADQFTAAAS